MGRTHAEEVYGELSPVAGSPCYIRGRTPLPEEEAVSDTTSDELTITSIPIFLCSGEEVEPEEGRVKRRWF